MHYYQPKYQKSNFIYQERPQPHPDVSSHSEKLSENSPEKSLEKLKET